MNFKDFQDQFQRAILKGDDKILDQIPDGPRETKHNLLGVYREAYILRLTEVVGNDHELLRTYLGDDAFGRGSLRRRRVGSAIREKVVGGASHSQSQDSDEDGASSLSKPANGT